VLFLHYLLLVDSPSSSIDLSLGTSSITDCPKGFLSLSQWAAQPFFIYPAQLHKKLALPLFLFLSPWHRKAHRSSLFSQVRCVKNSTSIMGVFAHCFQPLNSSRHRDAKDHTQAANLSKPRRTRTQTFASMIVKHTTTPITPLATQFPIVILIGGSVPLACHSALWRLPWAVAMIISTETSLLTPFSLFPMIILV
jgi:hypothetical protein